MKAEKNHRILFISHGGGPLPLLGDPGHQELISTLTRVSTQITKPSAIVVFSAHWESVPVAITAQANPSLIYDYYGFPPESYQIQYPAPGHPGLAERIHELLTKRQIPSLLDSKRGYDHGLFVPLKMLYPAADIPCVQVSLHGSLDAAQHIELGAAVAELVADDILIIGSGFSFHNMNAFFSPDTPQTVAMNQAFEDWLIETCSGTNMTEVERRTRLEQWVKAPYARYSHPREEHLLPLMVCYGAAQSACSEVFAFNMLRKRASMFLW